MADNGRPSDLLEDIPYMTVTMRDFQGTEPLPYRTFSLHAPDYSLNIGRGSQSEPHLRPDHGNAWFHSRVMSRNHALLKADPATRQLTIEDIGSMHGTYLDGRRLKERHPEILLQDDKLSFGTEIIRGKDSYRALQVRVGFDWSDDFDGAAPVPAPFHDNFRNSFTADYSEEDYYSEEEVEFIQESVRQPSVEIVSPPPTFVALHSDSSEFNDSDSDIQSVVEHPSSPSDPPDTSHGGRKVAPPFSEAVPRDASHDVPAPQTEYIWSEDQAIADALALVDNDESLEGTDETESDYGESDDLMEEDSDQELLSNDRAAHRDTAPSMSDSPGANPETQPPTGKEGLVGGTVRDPSPSDAAMAKPLSPVMGSTTFTPGFPSEDSRPPHSYNMYGDPDYCSFTYPSIWGSSTLRGQPGNLNSASMNYGDVFKAKPSGYRGWCGSTNFTPCNPPGPGHLYGSGHPAPTVAPVLPGISQALRNPFQVSFEAVVDPSASHATLSESKLKRKADQISDAPVTEPAFHVTTDSISATAQPSAATKELTLSEKPSSMGPSSPLFSPASPCYSPPSPPRLSLVSAVPEPKTTEITTKSTISLSPGSQWDQPQPASIPSYPKSQAPAMGDSDLQTETASVAKSIPVVASSNEQRSEPPHKRAKVDPKHAGRVRRQSSVFVRYAAAAVAGAAVGAVGTIFGLAALPQDYFA